MRWLIDLLRIDMPRKPKTSHTFRLGKTELKWLTRNGKGLGRQLREDLALLRALVGSDPSLTLKQALDLTAKLLTG